MTRVLGTAICVCAAMALNACGSSSASEETKELAFETKGAMRPPKVTVPPGPPPKKLVVEVLKKGTGEVAHRGDHLVVQYIGVDYETGKPFETHWQSNPWAFDLGAGEVKEGWEIAMKGMRVGERLKLTLPPRLAYHNGKTLIYDVELLAIERRCRTLGLC